VTFETYLDESAGVLRRTADAVTQAAMDAAIDTVVSALAANKPLLVCGNGGSAADAQHITGELAVRFLHQRRALKSYCLTSNPALLTACANDLGFETIFARQVEAYGEPGAVLLGLSTSGASANVIAAFVMARSIGMKTIALTGETEGPLTMLSDHLLAVPSRHTPLIQQAHLCLYHYLCMKIEERLL
jgi:D-sedoheptulose 7-phosphate isomerase